MTSPSAQAQAIVAQVLDRPQKFGPVTAVFSSTVDEKRPELIAAIAAALTRTQQATREQCLQTHLKFCLSRCYIGPSRTKYCDEAIAIQEATPDA